MRLKGRYIPDIKNEPAGIYEEPCGNGVAELRVQELSVMTIMPRRTRRKPKSMARKAAIVVSAIALPIAFVALADILAVRAWLFFGSFAVSVGWPAFVYWANVKD